MLCLNDQFIERRSAMPVMEGCRVVQIGRFEVGTAIGR